jgi:hypothetical protein
VGSRQRKRLRWIQESEYGLKFTEAFAPGGENGRTGNYNNMIIKALKCQFYYICNNIFAYLSK